jgi:hypothetical protein
MQAGFREESRPPAHTTCSHQLAGAWRDWHPSGWGWSPASPNPDRSSSAPRTCHMRSQEPDKPGGRAVAFTGKATSPSAALPPPRLHRRFVLRPGHELLDWRCPHPVVLLFENVALRCARRWSAGDAARDGDTLRRAGRAPRPTRAARCGCLARYSEARRGRRRLGTWTGARPLAQIGGRRRTRAHPLAAAVVLSVPGSISASASSLLFGSTATTGARKGSVVSRCSAGGVSEKAGLAGCTLSRAEW